MKTVKYVPTICKGDTAEWTGFVVLRLPSFDEKYEYIESIQADLVDEEGGVNVSNKLKSIRAMVKVSEKHYVEIALSHPEHGEVKCWDDMQYNDDMHGVLVEVAGLVLNGFKVGNG
jgi:hypothetical protein